MFIILSISSWAVTFIINFAYQPVSYSGLVILAVPIWPFLYANISTTDPCYSSLWSGRLCRCCFTFRFLVLDLGLSIFFRPTYWTRCLLVVNIYLVATQRLVVVQGKLSTLNYYVIAQDAGSRS